MTNPKGQGQRSVLQRIAHRVMLERGLAPEFSGPALAELSAIHGAAPAEATARDLRSLLWCSIDNDDSRDLDQLTVAESLPDSAVRILVAIADVDSLVKKSGALDQHARQNTTSVYTSGAIFPMLPERLSTDLTSLGFAVDRRAIVFDMVFGRDGVLEKSEIYPASVRNKAKLAYDSVAAWLEGQGPIPPPIAAVAHLDENLRLQDATAQKLRSRRHEHGALELETVEARSIFEDGNLTDLRPVTKNRAKELIEDVMIAANNVSARFLSSKHFGSVRRVVRTPKHWDLIMAVASQRGTELPAEPDGQALGRFLNAAKEKDPDSFPDLSLTIIKLMGAGEYVVEIPGADPIGHFGLAVKDYSHSTAPNRRFPDLITQRLLKAAIANKKTPYSVDELDVLAKHCTEQEDAAKKVERQMSKCTAALLLQSRIGATFDAMVTGVSDKGTWVRIMQPPTEGKLINGFSEKKIGDRIRVELVYTDVERGYIDFKVVH